MNSDAIFPECGAIVSYSPIKNEPSPTTLYRQGASQCFVISPTKTIDPILTAQKVSKLFEKIEVCIYVPGTAFDSAGTRYGRGGGWYDRFLSHVPHQWIRIGVCTPSQLSSLPLVREPHDQPVDWIAILDGDTVELLKTKEKRL